MTRPDHIIETVAAFLVGVFLAPFLVAWCVGIVQ